MAAAAAPATVAAAAAAATSAAVAAAAVAIAAVTSVETTVDIAAETTSATTTTHYAAVWTGAAVVAADPTALAVHGLVGEGVCPSVQFPGDVGELDDRDEGRQLQRLCVQQLEPRVAHLVFPRQLPNHQLGVPLHEQGGNVHRGALLEAFDQAAVLRHVGRHRLRPEEEVAAPYLVAPFEHVAMPIAVHGGGE